MSRRVPRMAPPLTNRQVADAAERLIERHCENVGKERVRRNGVMFDEVYEHTIYPEHEIGLVETVDLGVDDQDQPILGQFDPYENCANISSRLRVGDPRREFTRWHEIAHGILHGPWLRELSAGEGRRPPLISTELDLTGHTLHILERQANIFAAHAAAPTWLVQELLVRTFGLDERPLQLFYKGPYNYDFRVRGVYVRTKIEDFGHFCWAIAKHIKHKFWGLSTECLSYRVQDSGLVSDATRRRVVLHRKSANKVPQRLRMITALKSGVLQRQEAGAQ